MNTVCKKEHDLFLEDRERSADTGWEHEVLLAEQVPGWGFLFYSFKRLLASVFDT